jgi:hypothetical protein
MSQDNENVASTINRKFNEFNVMKIRLDTSNLVKEIETYLRGATFVSVPDSETGEAVTKRIIFGYPKANEKGIQSILSAISMRVNPHTVQGNFFTQGNHSEDFQTFVYHFHVNLAKFISSNQIDFDIADSDYPEIVVSVRDLVERFLSRSIDNLERESYGETTRSVESNVIKQKGGVGFFNT